TVVYLNIPKIDPETEKYTEYCELQEAPYEIVDRLKEDYEFISGDDLSEDDNGETFDIKTPIVTLKYPEKWKDKADIAITDDSVTIMRNGQEVIKLSFSGDEGYLLGEYNGTPVRITTYSGDDRELAAMRDDGDIMLDHLMRDPAFKRANQPVSE
ncbi:MAG: hypothetical protein J5766_04720, partial [Clostridia bacterium]|nr:hypothetical protein [Clostridia bacterium]